MKKIGIMGGTFDPIHIGHLILGENAYQQFHLEKVVFMPAGNPPHKQNREGRASDQDRMNMVALAVSSNPHFEVSDIEMNETGFTYTYKTLEKLKQENPDEEYYFIIGADSLFDLDHWMKPQRICDACTIVVATRNHTSNDELDQAITHVRNEFQASIVKLDTENIDVSSKMIRQWLLEDRTIRYYVPDPVIEYISENNVYGDLKPNMRVK